jgi:hypothetical protein
MAITFSTGPTNSQIYTDGNSVQWIYNGTTWAKFALTGANGPTGPTGPNLTDMPRIISVSGTVTNSAGGTLTVTGFNFASGCIVYVESTTATTTTFNSSTSVTATIPSGISTGTYFIYIYNSNGSSGFLPNGITIT